MRGSLTLTLYESSGDTLPLIVPIPDFIQTEPPRTDAALGGESSYSTAGNYLQSGTSFEIPAFWNVSTLLKEVLADRLLAIWQVREAKRLAKVAISPTGYRLELDDETAKVFEFGKTALTKTRTSVSGTTPYEADKGVYYFARRLVDIDAKPVFGKISNGFVPTSFRMKDIGVKI